MARIKGPRKVHRYSDEFKRKAVSLSGLAGVQVKDVAEALDIHPFMLSRWRKEVRDGRLRAGGRGLRLRPSAAGPVRREDLVRSPRCDSSGLLLISPQKTERSRPSG